MPVSRSCAGLTTDGWRTIGVAFGAVGQDSSQFFVAELCLAPQLA